MRSLNTNYSHDHHRRSGNNYFRISLSIILSLICLGSVSYLVFLIYTDAVKEKAIAKRKEGWIAKWKIIKPFIKRFPLGFILGFIRDLIVVAIERQTFE